MAYRKSYKSRKRTGVKRKRTYARAGRKSYTKGKRAGFKRRSVNRVRRGRSSRGVANNMRSKLLDILTVPQTLITADAKAVTVNFPTTPVRPDGYYGKRCAWFSNFYSLPRVTDIVVMADDLKARDRPTVQADLENQSVAQKFFITSSTMRIEYSNLSKGTVYMTAYFCKLRKSIPQAYSFYDPLLMLSQGFADRKWQNTTDTRGSAALTHDDLTAFDSTTFTHWVKIYKVKNLKLQGGESGKLSVTTKRPRTIHMEDVVVATNSDYDSYVDMPLLYSHIKGGKFILIKFTGEITGFENLLIDPPVTQTTPKMVFNTKYHYTYKQVARHESRISYNDSINTAGFADINRPNVDIPVIVTEQGQQRTTEFT